MRSAHFAGLGADPEFQGCGYGTAVMVGAINWYLTHGYDFIRFGMWDWNDKARRLYRRLGIGWNGGVIFGQSADDWNWN
ncbi:GNAT family N-acetyltransferase [Arcanobacterium hippocoleae]